MFKKLISKYLIYLFIGNLFFSINTFSQGHFAGGSFNPNDYFVPDAQGWVFSFYYAYSKTDFFDASGQKSSRIDISQNPPVSIQMGQNVRTHSIIPMALYFGKGKVLGARWGVLALPIFNSPNANVALDYYVGQNLVGSNNISINSFGPGDFYLQPIWLTWEKKKFSTTFSYGIWFATGKYKVNDPENVGLGYWSHNFRVANRYKPTAQTSLITSLTYEINHKQQGVDFRESPHFTLDIGGSYSLKMGHEIGFFGFGGWQTGTDKGDKAVLANDRIFGLGAFGSYWIKPGKLNVLGRFSQNFEAKNRFGGLSAQIGLNYMLLK